MTQKRNPKKPKSDDLERRVRELTEQSLELLDDLAKTRQKLDESVEAKEILHDRCARLEVLLDDARRRVRTTRASRDWRPAKTTAGELEVVIWASDGRPAGQALANTLESLPDAVVSVVTTDPDAFESTTGVTRTIVAEQATPAWQWNVAMAATGTPYVLFLHAGTRLEDTLTPEHLAVLGQDTVAMVQPVVDGKLGMVESGDFVFDCIPYAGSDLVVELSYLSPAAFLVARDAFEVLGTFDEDLVTWRALMEHCLRAADHGLVLLGLGDLHAKGMPPAPSTDRERDCMMLTAKRRPEKIAKILAGSEIFWELRGEELRSFLASLFSSLPGARDARDLVDVLVHEGVELSARTLSGHELADAIRSLDTALREMHGMACQKHSDALAGLLTQLEATAKQPLGDPQAFVEMFRSLTQRVELEHRTKAELHDIANGLRQHNEALHADACDLRAELEQLEKARRDADAKTSEVDRSLHKIIQDRDRQLIEMDRDKANFANELESVRGKLHDIEHAMATISEMLGGEVKGLLTVSVIGRLRELQRVFEERNKWVASLLGELQSKRIRIGRRKLHEHEQKFLEDQGRGPAEE